MGWEGEGEDENEYRRRGEEGRREGIQNKGAEEEGRGGMRFGEKGGR